MNKFICILKSSPEFKAEHVLSLKRNAEWALPNMDKFICISDVYIPGVDTIPLKYNYPGRRSMIEVFRMSGSVVVTGLDTLFVDKVPELFDLAEKTPEGVVGMIDSFNPKRTYANGIMVWNGDYTRILDIYKPRDASRHKLEQNYTIELLKLLEIDINSINGNVSGICSYKHHCKQGLPEDARIILFHGNPRPWEVNKNWFNKLKKKCKVQY